MIENKEKEHKPTTINPKKRKHFQEKNSYNYLRKQKQTIK